jgi:hypothetical protein
MDNLQAWCNTDYARHLKRLLFATASLIGIAMAELCCIHLNKKQQPREATRRHGLLTFIKMTVGLKLVKMLK